MVLKKIQCWISPLIQDTATEPPSDTTDKPTLSDTAIEPISGTPVNPSSDAAIEPIYWVNGLAGIRKSTIAHTVAEDAKSCKLLGASFFFSHQEKELSDLHLFIPTIVYQLTQSYPEVKSAIIKVLWWDPGIVTKSFMTQFNDLIVEPLCKVTSKPVVIVINALDECNNSKGAANRLFHAIVAHCAKAPSLCLLVTSWPKTYIRAVMNHAGLCHTSHPSRFCDTF